MIVSGLYIRMQRAFRKKKTNASLQIMLLQYFNKVRSFVGRVAS